MADHVYSIVSTL